MINEVTNSEVFNHLCLSAWRNNASFWNNTRKINPEIKSFISKVTDEVAARETLRVVDIGCGTGWLARDIVSSYNNAKYCGIDFNDAFIERLQYEDPENDYLLLDFNEPLPPGLSGRFNLVVSCLSLIEMPALEQVIANYKALLNPGGGIVIITLNPYVELIRLSASLEALQADLEIFRASFAPKFYKKEIMVDKQHSGKTYFGLLHPTEKLLGALIRNKISIIDYQELNLINSDAMAPIYVAYSLLV